MCCAKGRRFVNAGAPRVGTRFGVVAVATLLLAACRGPGSADSVPPAESSTWEVRVSHVLSTGSEFHLMAERFRDLMLERTGGRFRVVIYPSGQRVPLRAIRGKESSKVKQDCTICHSCR